MTENICIKQSPTVSLRQRGTQGIIKPLNVYFLPT
jgi:hypothetical protein